MTTSSVARAMYNGSSCCYGNSENSMRVKNTLVYEYISKEFIDDKEHNLIKVG